MFGSMVRILTLINPKTALQAFLKENDRFKIDKTIHNKLLFTCNPGGYLLCLRD